MVLLRKLRQEKGLSMNKLANLVGISCCVIGNIENKQYKSSNETMKKLADYFGIKEPLDLLKNADGVMKNKKCLNQVCLLNEKCYCQSKQVIEGAYCQSEHLENNPVKEFKFNNTQALFIK